ncbi:MAG: DUF503 domain-containing protein [Deltaproteobacteria bacterium]|nr:DUF503 domain-containing protein [Deltaproteobacteria bacterium]MBW2122164.1 DUF503 domain-containing protein [Deltaproteobacteria bacterium]
MVIGVCQVDLLIPGNASLKGKRKVLRKIIDRVKNRYNISISEVGDNDLWQRSQIGLSVVGNDSRHINSSLDKIIDFIEGMNVAEILNSEIEIIHIHGRDG